ncbi:hypothetical protein MTR67_011088 [Solanum verrucosum]|uniref:Reverse transcriptase n=1 Tax=Solanum verrucosum TaxID=315347 RepID=A0AAF0Q7E6_SOLVR|nr:hypothetical protein MTR67_011088 [Solanum verrucosum]
MVRSETELIVETGRMENTGEEESCGVNWRLAETIGRALGECVVTSSLGHTRGGGGRITTVPPRLTDSYTQLTGRTLSNWSSSLCYLEYVDWNYKKTYFKFENWWLEVEGFKQKVKAWWLSFPNMGKPAFTLENKLKLLKKELMRWSRSNEGDWKHKKEMILQQLKSREAIQENRSLTDDELVQKTHLAMEFEEIAKEEEIAWRQRSRVQWLKNGDKNTRFFYRMANAHKRYNSIDALEVEGQSINEMPAVKNAIQRFYQNLYKETEGRRPDLKLQGITVISIEDHEWLQRGFEEEEVWESIKSCAVDKAPGPDGFTMNFSQAFGNLVKEDIMGTLQYFHEHHVFERSLNATFAALIPKKAGAVELRDFGPISLISGYTR